VLLLFHRKVTYPNFAKIEISIKIHKGVQQIFVGEEA